MRKQLFGSTNEHNRLATEMEATRVKLIDLLMQRGIGSEAVYQASLEMDAKIVAFMRWKAG